MKIDVYNQTGTKAQSQAVLPKDIFGLEAQPDLVHQVVISQMANRRQGAAHAKDRAEVRGGGRKPWRQKGTGRARHGSIRSPLWRGGGVTFGPRNERNYKKSIPLKMKRKAMLMVLSAKVKNNFLCLLDSLKFDTIKTKQITEMLGKLPCKTGSVLIVLPEMDKSLILSSRNIAGVKTIQARELNALDLLSFKYVLMPKAAIKIIENTFVKSKTQMANVKSNPKSK